MLAYVIFFYKYLLYITPDLKASLSPRVMGVIVYIILRRHPDGVYFGNPSRKNWKSPI